MEVFARTNASFNEGLLEHRKTAAESKRIALKKIGSQRDKFSEHDLSALKDKHDLVTQVVEIHQL